MTALNPDQLLVAYDAIITDKSTTFAKESPRYSIPELKQAIVDVRSATRGQVEGLPSSAFAEQADDSEGNEVWSAGELICHVTSAFWFIGGRALELADIENPGPGEAVSPFLGETPKVLSKQETIDLLDAGDQATELYLSWIPDDADLSASADTEFFGEMSAKSWLMFVSVHEADHVRQLESLGNA